MNDENLILDDGFIFKDEEERRQFKNRVWYYKTYCSLIQKGLDREANGEIDSKGYYEKHHILPKCMGGKNDKNNLVKLTAREHIMAHILLAEVYPDNSSILLAAEFMTKYSRTDKNSTVFRRQVALKRVSTRIIAKIKEQSIKLVSLLRKGVKKSDKMKRKLSESKKGVVFSYDHRRKLSAARKGKILSDETKKKMSNKRKGENNPSAKKVLSPSGILYNTVKSAASDNNISRSTLSTWLNHNSEKGWRYYNPDENNNK